MAGEIWHRLMIFHRKPIIIPAIEQQPVKPGLLSRHMSELLLNHRIGWERPLRSFGTIVATSHEVSMVSRSQKTVRKEVKRKRKCFLVHLHFLCPKGIKDTLRQGTLSMAKWLNGVIFTGNVNKLV